jgi:hypothetical protein
MIKEKMQKGERGEKQDRERKGRGRRKAKGKGKVELMSIVPAGNDSEGRRKNRQINLKGRQVEMSDEDRRALSAFSSWTVGASVSFPVVAFATHRLFKRKGVMASSHYSLRIAAAMGISALVSFTLISIGFERMRRQIETLDTPFAALLREKRMQQPTKRDGSDVNN